jgi:predicted transcriptional regulator
MRRGPNEVCLDMLIYCETPRIFTHIMDDSRLTSLICHKYLEKLISLKLLEKIMINPDKVRHNSGRHLKVCYKVTQEGHVFAQQWRMIKTRLLEVDSSESSKEEKEKT